MESSSMLTKVLAAAVVLGLASTGAQAADWDVSGYIQGNLGQAKASKPSFVKKVENDHRGVAAELNTIPSVNAGARTSSDKTDTAYKLIVGLQLNPYVAIEAQYMDLGKSTYKAGHNVNFDGGSWSMQEKLDLSTAGYGANLVGTLPIDKFTLFAKAGLHNLKTKAKHRRDIVVITGFGTFPDSEKSSKSVTKWTQSFGIGASYEFIDNLAVVVEAERYRNVANQKVRFYAGEDKDKIKHNVDLFSAGIRYKF